MQANRIVEGTKSQYRCKIKLITAWFEKSHLEFKLPLSPENTLSFFGQLITPTPPKKQPAFCTVRGYKSALIWYYRENGMIIDENFNSALEDFLSGYKRMVSEWKLDGTMEAFEGKHHMTFAGYQIVSRELARITPERHSSTSSSNSSSSSNQTQFTFHTWNSCLLGWPFLVLQWNLMARSAMVTHLMLQHIYWQDDCMVIATPKHKGVFSRKNPCFL
jgi:hypothetical protein